MQPVAAVTRIFDLIQEVIKNHKYSVFTLRNSKLNSSQQTDWFKNTSAPCAENPSEVTALHCSVNYFSPLVFHTCWGMSVQASQQQLSQGMIDICGYFTLPHGCIKEAANLSQRPHTKKKSPWPKQTLLLASIMNILAMEVLHLENFGRKVVFCVMWICWGGHTQSQWGNVNVQSATQHNFFGLCTRQAIFM